MNTSESSTSRRRSLASLPPKRGRIKAQIFKSLGSLKRLMYYTLSQRKANMQYGMIKGLLSTSEHIIVPPELSEFDIYPPEISWPAVGEERLQESSLPAVGEERQEANERQKEEISHESQSEDISRAMGFLSMEFLEDCILISSIFPSDYAFTKDMLISQWIAEGPIKSGEYEMFEEAYIQCFDTMLNSDYIVPSGYNHDLDLMKYKFGDKMKDFLQDQMLEASKSLNSLESKETDMVKVEHLSIAFEKIDCINFGILNLCTCLESLMIHHCYGLEVKRLPSDLFSELKALKILNLSHTNIVELPSSIEKLEELRFLDVSGTPIRWLPESICCLTTLETLNLDGCSSLVDLPKGTSLLVNLRHLFLDIVRQLQSMPSEIGKLSKLQTLSGFLVGDEDDSSIVELGNMNKLKGSLRILYLENVTTKEDAAEARLWDKHNLKKIELHWSDRRDKRNPDEDDILDHLQPPFGIQELKIFFYSGVMLPFWISNPLFSELVSITLFACRYWESIPSLGELPSLKRLNIIENNEMTEINSCFCRRKETNHSAFPKLNSYFFRKKETNYAAFPKLEKLSFRSMSKLKTWTGIEEGDFPRLQELIVEYCPQFVHLPSLSHLSSLSHMEISYCPELSCLPEGGLPATLESLMIKDCPKLKDRCQNGQGKDWSKVAHVREFYIDNHKVLV